MGMRADIGGLGDVGGELDRTQVIEEDEGSDLTMADGGQHPRHVEPAKIAASVLQNMIQHFRRSLPRCSKTRDPRSISISDSGPLH